MPFYMAQVSLYLNNDLYEKISSLAKMKNCPFSKLVSSMLHEQLESSDRKNEEKNRMLRETFGSIDDETFVEPPELPLKMDDVRFP
jgi:hypothetical protein